MKAAVSFAIASLALVPPAVRAQSNSSGQAKDKSAAVAANYSKLPLSFELNQGQTDPEAKFISRGQGYSLFLTKGAAVLALTRGEQPASDHPAKKSVAKAERTEVVRMEIAGADRGVYMEGAEPLPGRVNYFIGSNPTGWRRNVPTYGKVRYTGIYPGVDLVYYGNQSQLEYDFLVAPGGDAKRIRLHFAGADKLSLNANGDLTVSVKDGAIAFRKPIAYQMKDGQRHPVDGRFTRLAGNAVGFRLGNYDRGRELIIDPVLAYSTYLGGSVGNSSAGDFGRSIAVDASGNAVVTGYTQSTDFPVTSGAYQEIAKSDNQVFVTKMNSTGSALIYSTYLGGTGVNGGGADEAFGVALDSAGNAYIAGFASSSDFPVTAGAFQTTNRCVETPGCSNGFVTELNPEGSALVFSTYLGGSGGPNPSAEDYCTAIALDSSNDIYLTGDATSYDFPVTAGAFQPHHNTSANAYFNTFVTKLSHDGSSLIYSTYLGGSGDLFSGGDYAAAVAVDSLGQAVAVGQTSSTDFPISPGAFQTVYRGNAYGTGYVTKLNADGTALVYSTFLGGRTQESSNEGGDGVSAVAVDSAGDAYVGGYTGATDFPVTSGAFQTTRKASYSTGFVAKLKPDGSGLLYGTYLGGSGEDEVNGVVVDSSGNAYIAGVSSSADFPVTADAFQTKNKAPDLGSLDNTTNGTFTKLNGAGSALLYSTYLGGSSHEGGYGGEGPAAIALDPSNNAYLTGNATSYDFPVTSGAYQKHKKGHLYYYNLFLAEFYFGANPAPIPTTTTLTSSSNPATADTPFEFTATVTTSNGTPVTAGQVNFTLNSRVYATVDLDASGTAVYSTSGLPPGTYGVVADYLGVSTELPLYSPSNSPTLTESVVNKAATPVISPATGARENPALQVQITSATPSAAIYYTTDGTTPTTASPLYKLPFTIYGTMKIEAIAVLSGKAPSDVATATYTSTVYPRTPVINFNENFTSPQMQINGAAYIPRGGGDLALMLYTSSSASSAFFTTPVNVEAFTTDFVYSAGGGVADGLTFTIQNIGPDALGGAGAGLGYVSIRKSVAVKFDFYNNVGEGPQSTGIYTGGNTPTIPAINLAGTGIALNSENLDVHLAYDGAVLNMTITDLNSRASWSHAWTIDIPSHVGAKTAYVGFTAGTGYATFGGDVSSWIYLPGKPSTPSFSSGLSAQGLTLNGSAALASSGLELTTGAQNQAGSAFFVNPVNIQSFTNNFTFRITDPVSDGFTFTIQNTGPTALGGKGAGLGYTTIHQSAAIKFDLRNNAGEGPNSTGLYTGGNTPTVPAIDLTGTGINLHSGDTMAVAMSYNGTVLNMTITDQVTSASWSHAFTVDLPAVVGGTTAFVGFTGGTGAGTSTQAIKAWTFAN